MLLDCKDILLENKKQLVKAFKLNVYEEHQNPWKIVFTSRLTVLLFIPLLLEVKKTPLRRRRLCFRFQHGLIWCLC